PGRLIDLAGQRLLDLSNATEVVLDEADKMLDLGFLADIEKIFQKVPAVRHTQLFSATMPGPIVALARRFMTNPIHIRANDPDEGLTQANIKHLVYRAHSLDKDEVIARILQAEGRGKTVIFTRTKRAAQRLVDELGDRGFNVGGVHGDMGQDQRERSMAAFKAGKKDVLVATDVAARGIDVDDVTHVINHTIPDEEKTYLHRAGRTGRAGKTGIAVTFVDWEDLHKWALINRALEFGQPEPIETYSSSPHLYTDLDIPEGTKGRLVSAPKKEPVKTERSRRPERAADAAVGAAAMKKAIWRLGPFLGLLYLVAYIDRNNAGFAKLEMTAALNITEAAFGFAAGIFFIGYLLFEVPSNLLLEKIGARKTLARITILWGAASMAMAYVTTPTMFYVLRF
ncbi:MAG: MFS transporter, partial [Microbacterium sp.]|nr:MFS transporter [Microbacterium sp.]